MDGADEWLRASQQDGTCPCPLLTRGCVGMSSRPSLQEGVAVTTTVALDLLQASVTLFCIRNPQGLCSHTGFFAFWSTTSIQT